MNNNKKLAKIYFVFCFKKIVLFKKELCIAEQYSEKNTKNKRNILIFN